MSEKYGLSYKSPLGDIRVEANSFRELEKKVSADITRMIAPQTILENMSLDDAAEKALIEYHMSNRCGSASSISKAGVELDVIKCYLQNMTINQIVEWLKVNKNVPVSKSAVGRFCTRLFKLCIAPIGSVQAHKGNKSG